MDAFLTKVERTISGRALLRRRGKVIVAVSGGADSVALLAALDQLGYECVGAHCNFHLRGDESVRDMRHVETVAAMLGVDLYVKDFDVESRRRQTGESVEMACRELRYRWFYDLLDRDYAQCIAVGHHREDQVETFFLNLLRGTGIAGLTGMQHRTGHIVRPLLDCSRADIEDYLHRRGLQWVDDSSNSTDDYARNRLRNRVIPLLNELFEGASDGILRTMSMLRDNRDVYARAIERARAEYAPEGEIDLLRLSETEPDASVLLFEILRSEGFNRTQTDGMLAAASRSGGVFAATDSHVREVDHGILRAPHAAVTATSDMIEINPGRDILSPVHIAVSRHDIREFKPERNPAVIYIDVLALDGDTPWRLRHRVRGDRMTPYGMRGTKLVSDIYAEAKLSSAAKRDTWLLTRGDDILWVVGIRPSALFTIGPDTRQYLRLELLK